MTAPGYPVPSPSTGGEITTSRGRGRRWRGKRDHRGFAVMNEFPTRWHGNLTVKESSVAFEGACVWIFADLSYSNEPMEHAPALHLKLEDAERLHKALGAFLAAAKADKLTEPSKPGPGKRPWYGPKGGR